MVSPPAPLDSARGGMVAINAAYAAFVMALCPIVYVRLVKCSEGALQ